MAQLVEQLTFNQWVTGSSPVRVIYAGVAELADAPDLGSGVVRRVGSSPSTRMKVYFSERSVLGFFIPDQQRQVMGTQEKICKKGIDG